VVGRKKDFGGVNGAGALGGGGFRAGKEKEDLEEKTLPLGRIEGAGGRRTGTWIGGALGYKKSGG